MTTKLVLNRREGVVAAQDVHLNRSVYSQLYPIEVWEIGSVPLLAENVQVITKHEPPIRHEEGLFVGIARTSQMPVMDSEEVYGQAGIPMMEEGLINHTPSMTSLLDMELVPAFTTIKENAGSMGLATLNRITTGADFFFKFIYNSVILDKVDAEMAFTPKGFKVQYLEENTGETK